MRMAQTITLVLLGGGVALGGATMLGGGGSPGRQRECHQARTANRADAEQICASASTRSGGGGAWFVGSSRRSGPALGGASGFRGDAGSSVRGGFGSIGRGFASSSGG